MIYILLILCFFSCITTKFLLYKGAFDMSNHIFQTIISILTIIVSLATLIISIYKIGTKTNKKIDNLNIGKIKGQTLCKYLINNFHNLNCIIGKSNNDKTLTDQHKDLQKALNKEINLIEQRYAEDEKRLNQFTNEQQNTARAIKDFKLFMESWTKTASENNDLKIKISSMQQQINLLNHKINELEKQNQILEFKSYHNSDKHHSQDNIEL